LYSKLPPNPLLFKEGENILGKSPLYRRGDLGVIYSTEKEKYKTPKGFPPLTVEAARLVGGKGHEVAGDFFNLSCKMRLT